MLRDPALTGNRSRGWSFVLRYQQPRLEGERLSLGDGTSLHKLVIHETGRLTLELPLERLYWKGPAQDIYPWIPLEYSASVCRLARELYQGRTADTTPALADIAGFGIQGWSLRPGSPDSIDHSITPLNPYPPEGDLLFSKPVVSRIDRLCSRPDAIAFLLMRRFYQSFNLTEDAIPQAYDRVAEKLVIPD